VPRSDYPPGRAPPTRKSSAIARRGRTAAFMMGQQCIYRIAAISGFQVFFIQPEGDTRNTCFNLYLN
jgi:hypothetical protein